MPRSTNITTEHSGLGHNTTTQQRNNGLNSCDGRRTILSHRRRRSLYNTGPLCNDFAGLGLGRSQNSDQRCWAPATGSNAARGNAPPIPSCYVHWRHWSRLKDVGAAEGSGQAEGRDSSRKCPAGVLGPKPFRGAERCHGAGLWEVLLMPVGALALKAVSLCIAAASAAGEQTPRGAHVACAVGGLPPLHRDRDAAGNSKIWNQNTRCLHGAMPLKVHVVRKG